MKIWYIVIAFLAGDCCRSRFWTALSQQRRLRYSQFAGSSLGQADRQRGDFGGLDPGRAAIAASRSSTLNQFATVIVFLLELSGGDAFVNQWSAVPADIVAGRDLVTILTSMFMHGSWSHIIGNMIFLWAFGPQIEDAMGRLRYVAFYLLGGVVATLAQVLVDPTSTIPSLGASGAIAAVMGAFLVTYPRETRFAPSCSLAGSSASRSYPRRC